MLGIRDCGMGGFEAILGTFCDVEESRENNVPNDRYGCRLGILEDKRIILKPLSPKRCLSAGISSFVLAWACHVYSGAAG